MTITIDIDDDEWREIQQDINIWDDETFALRAAYYFREALESGGYIEE